MKLQKHTLNLREGDYDRLGELFASKGIKPANVIRAIVSRYVDHLTREPSAEELASVKEHL